MVDFIWALKKPIEDFKKLTIGAAFIFLSFIIFPAIVFVLGYLLKVAQRPDGRSLPEWEDWVDIFKKGLTAFIICIIYLLPLIVLAYLIFALSGLSGVLQYGPEMMEDLASDPAYFATVIASMGSAMLLSIFLVVVYFYTMPLPLVFYAEHYRFNDAFNFRKLFRKIIDKHYFISVLFAFAYFFIGAFAVSLLGVPFGGTFIPLILHAYFLMMLFTTSTIVFGQVNSEIK